MWGRTCARVVDGLTCHGRRGTQGHARSHGAAAGPVADSAQLPQLRCRAGPAVDESSRLALLYCLVQSLRHHGWWLTLRQNISLGKSEMMKIRI